MVEVSIFAPLKNERYSVSAEELLDKQKHYKTSKRDRRKTLIFLSKRVVSLKRVCIFAVPIKGAQE